MYEREHYYASNGKANAGLTTGIIGTVLSGLLTLGGGLGTGVACNPTGTAVNRFELEQETRISHLESQIALRDANTYAMQQLDNFRNYVDKKFDCINDKLATQAVVNEKIIGNVSCLASQVNALDALTSKVIPASSICPEVMARYNSWTAPTTSASTGA